MAIPTQNEFLLPFLRLLSDGQTVTRAQALYRLAQGFGISEDEAQAMSGNQFTLVSRLAWCDVHFVKAGFAVTSGGLQLRVPRAASLPSPAGPEPGRREPRDPNPAQADA